MNNFFFTITNHTMQINQSKSQELTNDVIEQMQKVNKVVFWEPKRIRTFGMRSDTSARIYHFFNGNPIHFPDHLTELILPNSFNKPIHNTSKSFLPSSLEYINFGNSFNQTIDILPSNLKKITFGNSFNRLVDNLPKTIKEIEFGNSFNQSVDNLPIGIEIITFGLSFTKTLDNLPITVKKIYICDNFKLSLDNVVAEVFKFKRSFRLR